MFNKNVFTQTDAVADLIKGINEADYLKKMEALIGGQKKIDKNHNGKVDGDDFKILRGEKKVNEDQVEENWDEMLKSVKDKAGPQPNGGSGKKQGSAYGGSKQKDKPEQKEEIDPSVKTTETLKGTINGKSANPFLKAKVKLNVNERSLSPAEKDAVEVNVKSMKKNLAGFKARYGKDAKSVMYATATKQAKKD